MQVEPDLISRESLQLQLEQVESDFNRSAGIPPACYADAGLLALERRAVFQQGWVALGFTDRWRNAGDYAAMDIGGVPLIAVCNRQGQLKAFANSCRHRGSALLGGSGNCSKIKCPFHWWTYDLDGRLKVYPRMENALDFDPADYGLVEFPVVCSHGLAFTSFAQTPPDFGRWLGDFGERHAQWRLEDMVVTRLREFEVACNWKTFIEVFNEYYHLPSVHPDSINWLYPEPDPVDEVRGAYTTQFGATDGAAALLFEHQDQALPVAAGLRDRFRQGTRYTWIYPNLTFAASQDSLWMYQAFPLAADRCHVVQTIAFPSASVALQDFGQRALHYYDRIDAALAEDLPFLEQQQRGLNSRFARPGRFGALEPSVGKFAYWYARQLLADLDAS
ncbi:MAG: aromatic ring-hydroxylating dioxygenase subunit alpha [Gammaproteobacteria bacterium]|nr:aromatic ring-hydroxylating dioxygenase subunit alpha [Gammaproteobacteria bacterium]MDH3448404.1 aromatic ring-hydroxylating dioxygenase subunit alpha [Gammaproteobacteria bacterium]